MPLRLTKCLFHTKILYKNALEGSTKLQLHDGYKLLVLKCMIDNDRNVKR